MTYQIIDNFLPADVFERYQDILLSDSGVIPMFYSATVGDETDRDLYYFIHIFYDFFRPCSDFFDSLVIPLFQKLEADHGFKAPLKAKVNWYPSTNEIIEHKKHVDWPQKHNVCVFYVNNCNGFTRLGDDIIVESVANRALIFDGGIHNSSTCTDANMRCSINIDFV